MKYILPSSIKYVFKSLAGSSLRYEVFLASKMFVLRCQLLAKLGRPEISTPPFKVNTHTYIYIYIYIYIYKFASKCHSQTIRSSEWRKPGPENIFQYPLLTSKPATIKQSAETYILYLYIIYVYFIIYIFIYIYIYTSIYLSIYLYISIYQYMML